MSFAPEELERYARHIILRELGGPGQQKLKAAHVTVIGAGGLGAPALLYLAAAGVGTLRIVDDDHVSLSNLQRQVIHTTGRVGLAKTESAAAALAAVNPHVALDLRAERLTPDTAAGLLSETHMVLDGSDSFATRRAVNAAAHAAAIPLVSGALGQWEGQLTVFDTARGTPCYACIFPEDPLPGQAPSCAEAGIVGALAGVVGAMMAGEAIKLVTGAGAPLRGEMLFFDLLWGENRKIRLSRREACPVCG